MTIKIHIVALFAVVLSIPFVFALGITPPIQADDNIPVSNTSTQNTSHINESVQHDLEKENESFFSMIKRWFYAQRNS